MNIQSIEVERLFKKYSSPADSYTGNCMDLLEFRNAIEEYISLHNLTSSSKIEESAQISEFKKQLICSSLQGLLSNQHIHKGFLTKDQMDFLSKQAEEITDSIIKNLGV